MRKRRGLSLRGAAKATGLSHAYIGAIENAEPNANVTLETLETLATGLGARLGVALLEDADQLAALTAALAPGERDTLATIARALLAARRDSTMEVVVGAAVDMIAGRLPADERAHG